MSKVGPLRAPDVHTDDPRNVKEAAQKRAIGKHRPFLPAKDKIKKIGELVSTLMGLNGQRELRMWSESQIEDSFGDFLKPAMAKSKKD